jgi:hypothetical protein
MVVTGIGLVDFSVKAHYNSSRDRELKELSKEGRIYGIPAGSALVYKDGALSFIGEVCLFEDGTKTSVNSEAEHAEGDAIMHLDGTSLTST